MEVTLRGEMQKIHDALRDNIDSFKTSQAQVTDRLGEMIRVEVDQRMQSDRDTKQMVQNLLKNVMSEVSQIKEGHNGGVGKVLKEVKEAQKDSAERASFLSSYIDQQITKVNQRSSKQSEHLKVLCAKLTE